MERRLSKGEKLKLGKKTKCPFCGRTYTVPTNVHRQFCEVLNPESEDDENG